MSYADMVFATVPDAPPTWKNRRATSWPAPISANVPYFFASRLIWNAFLFVPTSISGFISTQSTCGHLAGSQLREPVKDGAVRGAGSDAEIQLEPHLFETGRRDPAATI